MFQKRVLKCPTSPLTVHSSVRCCLQYQAPTPREPRHAARAFSDCVVIVLLWIAQGKAFVDYSSEALSVCPIPLSKSLGRSDTQGAYTYIYIYKGLREDAFFSTCLLSNTVRRDEVVGILKFRQENVIIE